MPSLPGRLMDGWRREDYMSSDEVSSDVAWKKGKSGDFWAYFTLGMYVGGRRYIVGEVCVCVRERLSRVSPQQHSNKPYLALPRFFDASMEMVKRSF